jgi:nucleotide-binding universal stress UspA family protein
MFDQVIVALDDGEAGLDALALGETLASERGRLTLVHVEVDGTDQGAAGDAKPRTPLASVRGSGGAERPLVVLGATSLAPALHEFASRNGADLLVIGASGRDFVDRALGRDPAERIIEDAPCAVAVAPAGYAGRARPLRTVGVGYDGSLGSEAALATARQLAEERHTNLSAFEAVPVRMARDPLNTHDEIEERIAAAKRQLTELGDVEPHAAYGSRAEELARYGTSVDLLVIGPREHAQAPGPHLGTLAQRLAHRAPCPLLVVSKAAVRIGPGA